MCEDEREVATVMAGFGGGLADGVSSKWIPD